MDIRTATDQDIPEIVNLLKTSLGESLMPKSEQYWHWKHIDNPFGASPVFLAFDDNQLIGVRAFMRWQWQQGKDVIHGLRAVDTSTHPNYQGKGIFTKLTMALIEHCNEQRLNMVYNTPNEKSLPGYLKMGWQQAGKLPITIKVVHPLKMCYKWITNTNTQIKNIENNQLAYYLNHNSLNDLITTYKSRWGAKIITDHSIRTLKWRYAEVPRIEYSASGIESNGRLTGLFFYRIKESKLGRELRITDLFLESEAHLRFIKQVLKGVIKELHVDYVTFGSLAINNVLEGFLSYKSKSVGPIVTVRNINLSDINGFLSFVNWNPSVGDLELF